MSESYDSEGIYSISGYSGNSEFTAPGQSRYTQNEFDYKAYGQRNLEKNYVSFLTNLRQTNLNLYYNWFYERLHYLVNKHNEYYNAFTSVQYDKTIHPHQTKIFQYTFYNLIDVLGAFYNYKYIYDYIETGGNVDPNYDFNATQYFMMMKLFNFYNHIGDILVPSIFQLWLQENANGRFLPETNETENPLRTVEQIRSLLPHAQQIGKNLVVFIKILYTRGTTHANLMVFTPDKKIYVIEPNFTNIEDNLDEEEVRLMKSVKGFLTMYFPDYTFRFDRRWSSKNEKW
jgi:hypothetical protein